MRAQSARQAGLEEVPVTHRVIRRLLAAMAASALAGCGGATTPAVPGGPTSVHVVLGHVPRGQASLTYDPATKALTVDITVSGLAPDSIHPAHIHAGSCEHQGAIVYPLPAVSANPVGLAADRTATVTHIAEARIPATGWYLNVHNGPDLMPAEQFQPIACANIENSAGANNVTVPLEMGPSSTPNQVATGAAELSIDGGMLKIVATARGLAPNSAHAMHLHLGSCEAQGPVVFPLHPLTADGGGEGSETTLVGGVTSIPRGQWYINVHRGTKLDTQTDFDPIICGNVNGG